MKLIQVKTTRFSEVVEKCGRPVSYTLWLKPKKDPALAKLIAKKQIMTIRRGQGADFGEVGFFEAKSTIYLQFPKSLKAFADQRILGIKWEFLQT
ncbi:MAG: hypothetical protein M3R59_04165 [Verrucomicrobiota bacterium]|nr:hypothetical protein [Verrucomicrobiota bacterium]